MKRMIVIIAMTLSMVNLFAQTGAIKLTIKGINPKMSNNIKIALYDEGGFLKDANAHKTIKSSDSTVYTEFKNIQVGKYAISVFQDENSDGKLNTTFYGKPVERNGFSNNIKASFGPPSFSDVVFIVTKDKYKTLTIHLN